MDSTTSETFLEALRDNADSLVWIRFNNRYRPMILGFAMKLGVPETDAADIAQDTILTFVKAFEAGKYQREQGRLRSWLFGIAKRKILDWRRKNRVGIQAQVISDATDVFHTLPSREEIKNTWRTIFEQAVLRAALADVAKAFDAMTMESFRRHVVLELPATKVAEELGITVGTVYSHKSRVMDKLRERMRDIDQQW